MDELNSVKTREWKGFAASLARLVASCLGTLVLLALAVAWAASDSYTNWGVLGLFFFISWEVNSLRKALGAESNRRREVEYRLMRRLDELGASVQVESMDLQRAIGRLS